MSIRPKLMVMLAMVLLSAPVAAGWPTVPLPENSKGETVSRHMTYNGLPMRASRFSTTQEVEEIVAFYARKWNGKYVVDQLEGKTIIGHADGDHYVTVEVEPAGGGSEGTVGIVEMPAEGAKPELGKDFYRPGGTEVISDITYHDTPNETRTLVLQNQLSPYVNQQHYLRRMRANGWSTMDSAPCLPASSQCVGKFEKGGDRKMVVTTSRDSKMLTSTVVTIE